MTAQNRMPDAFLSELRARTDLAALIGRDVALKKNGREFSGLCPFHKERSPSFTVNPAKGFYHCFGCSAHGDAIAWMMEGRGLEFMPAVEALADLAGMEVPGRRRDPGRRVSQGKPLAPLVVESEGDDQAQAEATRRKLYALWGKGEPLVGSLAAVYLQGRGISAQTIARLQALRYAVVPYWWQPPPKPGQADRQVRPVKLGEWPCMIAAVSGPDGRFVALHHTWLADGGRGKRVIVAPNGEALKAKKVRGRAGGGAIRLVPLPEGATAMGGAEGIETAASVIQAMGEGLPVWALYSLGNLAGGALGQGRPHPRRRGVWLPSVAPDPERPGFLPPPGIERFTWFADGDGRDPDAADCTIKRGAARQRQAGCVMAVAKAPVGRDWNDILTEGAAHG
jgi:hypothetical protein